MVFDNLSNKEKVYWLNYLLRMEDRFAQQTKQLSGTSSNAMHPRRRALLKDANLFYQQFYTQIKEDLYPLVSKEALLTPEVLAFNYKGISTFSLGYIMRDWGNGQDNEQQQIITQTIEQKLQTLALAPELGKALFMGCGMGRYAVDFAHRYEKVAAFDASALMIWCIEYLQKVAHWEVLNKAARNCRTVEDTVQRMLVQITAAQQAIIETKVDFFVANATSIPLEKQSVDHIYSIYFTDVLPLPTLYQEVNDLLVEEGLFIHFGPLEYFFEVEEEMLSAEEVRLFFEAQGYHILVDEFLATKHLSSENSMRHRVYDNWFFIAQKSKSKTVALLDMQTVLYLNDKAEISSTSLIEQGSCAAVEHQAKLGAQSYELPAIVYELLLQINGKATIQLLLETLELTDIAPEDQERLLQILQELATSNILQTTPL
ncbi:MAG: hypothetical protein ACRBFS_06650 [Aureispira sp.]